MSTSDTKWVADIEAKSGAKGTYWTVTWHDTKKDTLFDEDWKNICEKAQTGKLAVHFTKEKKGDYWNIVSLELVEKELPQATDPRKNEPPEGKPPGQKTVSEDIKDNMKWKSDTIEVNMWWNHLGARIADGSLAKAYPNKHVEIETIYWTKMFSTLGIK